MAEERLPIDISDDPMLVRLAEEVRASGMSLVLQIGSEDVAVLTFLQKAKTRGGRAVTSEDALFRLVGIGSSGIPGGVSGHKHEALLRARRAQ